MGTSQSRTTTDGSSATVDRLKRYSRADLKSPLKAFGRQQQAKDSVAASAGHGGTKPGGTESTPASDYETPIYETSQRKAAVPVRCTYLFYLWLCPNSEPSCTHSFITSSHQLHHVHSLSQCLPRFPAR